MSRELLVSKTGLSGFKRILYCTKKKKDPKKLRSIKENLQINIENLQATAEKAPKYLRKSRNEKSCKLVQMLPVPFRRGNVCC